MMNKYRIHSILFFFLLMIAACNLDEIEDSIENPLTACFSYSVQGGSCGPDNVIQFTSCSVLADSYSWDFGDGTTSTQANPSHTYTASGDFIVILSTTNDLGTKDTTATISISSAENVYVAGEESIVPFELTIAQYWKNGVQHILSDGNSAALARGIFVSEGDVYVGGADISLSGTGYARYWKNGIPNNMSDGSYGAVGWSVFVSGSNVYVSGYASPENNGEFNAWYWVNNNNVQLSDVPSHAPAMFVHGSDIYVAGFEFDQNVPAEAVYWKNGFKTILPKQAPDRSATTSCIFISNNEIFIGGQEEASPDGNFIAKYWRNGISNNLTNGVNNAGVNSIFVHENKVYVAGYEENTSGNQVAKIWIDGQDQTLTNGVFNAEIKSIYVTASAVYTAGYEENSGGKKVAKYWKDGQECILSDGTYDAEANSIFISVD